MIRVTIEMEHGDGEVRIVRDDSYVSSIAPVERVKSLVAAAEASAIAAMCAVPERRSA